MPAAKLPVCALEMVRSAGGSTITVSIELLLVVLVSPPPETVAVLV